MIHTCNIYCHTIDLDQAELMGVETKGRWLPFAFHMDTVIACKMTTDEENHDTFKCTTIFTDHNDTYIVDTRYLEVLKVFQLHYADVPTSSHNDEPDF